MKISVIGAGPAGSYTSFLLSKHHDVKIIEEHKKIGHPVQCTGIITSKINDYIKIPKDIILNKIKYANIHSPNNNSIKLKVNDYVINRSGFDKYLFEKAVDNGVKPLIGSKFKSFNNKEISLGKNSKKIKTDILIGADGPNSKVRSLITNKKINFLTGKQALINGDFDIDSFEIHFNVDGFFSWVVPIDDNHARVGYAYSKFSKKYDEFIKSKGRILKWQAGIIPMFDPFLKTQKDNKFIVGDAATQIKSSTGGGIIPGVIASQALKTSIDENKNYDIQWRKQMLKELYTHKKIRDILNKFNKSDYNDIVKKMNLTKNSNIIGNSSRDNISSSIIKLIMSNPSFLKYGTKLFK